MQEAAWFLAPFTYCTKLGRLTQAQFERLRHLARCAKAGPFDDPDGVSSSGPGSAQPAKFCGVINLKMGQVARFDQMCSIEHTNVPAQKCHQSSWRQKKFVP